MNELEQHTSVPLHRPAHVADQYKPTRGSLPPLRRQVYRLPAISETTPQRPSQIELPAVPASPAPCSTPSQVPLQLFDHRASLNKLVRRVFREALLAQHLPRAEGAGQVDPVDVLLGLVLTFVHAVRRRAGRGRPHLRLPETSLLAHRPQVHRRLRVLGLPPEDVERLVEQRQVVLSMNEQRSERRPKVAFLGETDVVDDGHGVKHPSDVNVHAQAAEEPPEQQQVVEDVSPRRVSHACRHVARLDSSLDSAGPSSAPRAPSPRPRGT